METKGLTLAGKIIIFRSFMLSKVLYIASMSAVPHTFLDKLEKHHKDFILNGQKPKLRHSILIAYYHDGGYEDIDILSALNFLKTEYEKRFCGK